MQEIDRLLNALRARLDAFEDGDPSKVLEQEALAEEGQLNQAARSASLSGSRLASLMRVVADLHWSRYLILSDKEERDAALMLFALLSRLDKNLVPEPIKPLLTEFFEFASSATSAGRPDHAHAVAAQRGQEEPATVLKRAIASEDDAQLDYAIDLLRQAITATPVTDPQHFGYVSNLGVALKIRYDRAGQIADINEALSAMAETVKATPAGSADAWRWLTNLGLALRSRYERIGETSDLNGAVRFLREAAEAVEPDDAMRAGLLQNLVIVLQVRFQKLSDMADLEEAIQAGEEAVAVSPRDDADRRHQVFNLGNCLKARFDRDGQRADLDEAVRLLREAAEATPPQAPDRAEKLNNLLHILWERFERFGKIEDLEERLRVARMILEVTAADSPERAERLSSLGMSLLSRFERVGELGDLEEGIKCGYEALETASPDHPQRAGILHDLGNELLARFNQLGDMADLEKAVGILREAVAASQQNPEYATYMSALGFALRIRYARQQRQEDIDESVDYSRRAVKVTTSNPIKLAIRLSHLGFALRARFEGTGRLADLDEAMQAFQAAVDATPSSHVDRGGRLSNLGFALWVRFSRLGGMTDLDEAVRVLREAVNASSAYPVRQAGMLSNLSVALRIRFERLGDLSDLHEAVRDLRKSVGVTSPTHSDRPARLLNLSVALRVRFQRLAEVADINDAVQAGRDSVTATPDDDPKRPGRLSSLAGVLQVRFEQLGNLTDIEEAVEFSREAVAGGRGGGEGLATRLSTLGIALRNQFESAGDMADLDEAIQVHQQALEAIEADHPLRATFLLNLGGALRTRFDRTRQLSDARQAMATLQEASQAETAAIFVRLTAATGLGQLEASLDLGSQSALRAYETAVDLLPLLAWHGVGRASREHLLRDFPLLGSDAAACAIATGQVAEAVELLEQGRAVLWSQLLETRSNLTDLKNVHPELASRLSELRGVLDSGAESADTGAAEGWTTSPMAIMSDVDYRMRAAQEWDDLVARVRKLPGFHSFLRRPDIEELQSAASEGPVVVINISRWRCDALVIEETHIRVVPLPHLSLHDVVERAGNYLRALEEFEENSENEPLSPTVISALEEALTGTLAWLWDAIAEPVVAALGHTQPPSPGKPWPRVWWCPTGPLIMLPLHAAGRHDPASTAGRSVLDRVISSYAPTLRALVEARAAASTARPDDEERLLLVTLPDTPGQQPLHAVTRERDLLINLLPEDRYTLLENAAATRETVRTALGRHAWAHLSCHGTQNLDEPSEGGILLYDGMLKVTDIGEGASSRGQLMFLSACQTMMSGITNFDEVITLATALQYTGWQQVIATTWSVWANAAADVTGLFYPPISTGEYLEPRGAAEALHHAIRALRTEKPFRPSVWAPFVHVGL